MHPDTQLFLNRFENLLCNIKDFSFYRQPDGSYNVILDKSFDEQNNQVVCKQLINDMVIALIDPYKTIQFSTDRYFLNIESWQNIFLVMDVPQHDIERLLEIFVPTFSLYTAVKAAKTKPHLLPKVIDVYLAKGGYFPDHYILEICTAFLAHNVDDILKEKLVATTVKFLQHHQDIFLEKRHSQPHLFNHLRNILPQRYWKQLLVAFPEVKPAQGNSAPLFVHQSMHMEVLQMNYATISNDFPRFMLPEDIDEVLQKFIMYVNYNEHNILGIKKFSNHNGRIEIVSEKAINISNITHCIYDFFKDCADLEFSQFKYVISNDGDVSFFEASLSKSMLERDLEPQPHKKTTLPKI